MAVTQPPPQQSTAGAKRLGLALPQASQVNNAARAWNATSACVAAAPQLTALLTGRGRPCPRVQHPRTHRPRPAPSSGRGSAGRGAPRSRRCQTRRSPWGRPPLRGALRACRRQCAAALCHLPLQYKVAGACPGACPGRGFLLDLAARERQHSPGPACRLWQQANANTPRAPPCTAARLTAQQARATFLTSPPAGPHACTPAGHARLQHSLPQARRLLCERG